MNKSILSCLFFTFFISHVQAGVVLPECYGLIPAESDGTITQEASSRLASRKVCLDEENNKVLKNGYQTGNFKFTFFDSAGKVVKKVEMSAYHNDLVLADCCGPFTRIFGTNLNSLHKRNDSKLIVMKRSMEDSLVTGTKIGEIKLFNKAHFILTEIAE